MARDIYFSFRGIEKGRYSAKCVCWRASGTVLTLHLSSYVVSHSPGSICAFAKNSLENTRTDVTLAVSFKIRLLATCSASSRFRDMFKVSVQLLLTATLHLGIASRVSNSDLSRIEVSPCSFLNELDISASDRNLLFGSLKGLQTTERQPTGRL